MEDIKYSILVCPYSNGYQFSNFLWTACRQKFDNYEIIIVDNATPTTEIYDAYKKAIHRLTKLRYFLIQPENKLAKNITQGINLAAEKANGKYVVIIADSNVLLSFNLLSEIDKLIEDWTVIISGCGTDIKISINGHQYSEYAQNSPKKIKKHCQDILKEMGWPRDPNKLGLIEGKHRFPIPHNDFDVYLIAMNRQLFLDEPYKVGGSWGNYHSFFVRNKCLRYNWKRLEDIRIIHQYHRVWKDNEAAEY